MYNLSEQPIPRIIDEMTDFTPLKNRTAIYTVKERFSIEDTVYEVSDLIAVRGFNSSEVEVVPYVELLKQKSESFELRIYGKTLSISSVDKFKELFSFSEKETSIIEDISKECKAIHHKIKMTKTACNAVADVNKSQLLLILLLAEAFVCACSLFIYDVLDFAHIGAIMFIVLSAIILLTAIVLFSLRLSYEKDIKRYVREYEAIDEKRLKEGTLLM